MRLQARRGEPTSDIDVRASTLEGGEHGRPTTPVRIPWPARPPAGGVALETEKQRVDRELIEQLYEFRVALPGVQVLFAFLLVLPFQTAFVDATQLQRGLYYLAFIATATALVLLTAPTTYHRIRFRERERDRAQMLETSNRLFLIAMGLLGVAIVAVTYLVTSVVLGNPMDVLAAVLAAVLVACLWFGLPLVLKARDASRGIREGDIDGEQVQGD